MRVCVSVVCVCERVFQEGKGAPRDIRPLSDISPVCTNYEPIVFLCCSCRKKRNQPSEISLPAAKTIDGPRPPATAPRRLYAPGPLPPTPDLEYDYISEDQIHMPTAKDGGYINPLKVPMPEYLELDTKPEESVVPDSGGYLNPLKVPLPEYLELTPDSKPDLTAVKGSGLKSVEYQNFPDGKVRDTSVDTYTDTQVVDEMTEKVKDENENSAQVRQSQA